MQEDIQNVLSVLKSGGVILYPTDTIWGIGCDATNEKAVERVYKIKKRVDSKSMLVLVDSENRILQYVNTIPEIAWQLIEVSFRPLTIIYPDAKNLAPNLIAEDNSIGIRVTKDDFCKEIIKRFRKPVVSTSANISGQPAPATFMEISDDIKNSVDYIVKWRQNDITKSSASEIIKIEKNGEIKIIRSV